MGEQSEEARSVAEILEQESDATVHHSLDRGRLGRLGSRRGRRGGPGERWF